MGWSLSFLNDVHYTHRVIRGVVGDFLIEFNIKP
jgi:hypothetical protein